MHRGFLLMFILGVALSAIFTTIEFRYLDVHHADHATQHGLLKASYLFKILIVTVEIALAVAFGVTLYKHIYAVSGVLEWTVSFLFTFYLLSFAVDLWPAAKASKGDFALENVMHHEHANGHVNGHANGYSNGHTNGYANGNGNGNGNGFPANGYANGNGHNAVELGRGGAATIVGVGHNDAHAVNGPGGHGGDHFGMRHYDDSGRQQTTY